MRESGKWYQEEVSENGVSEEKIMKSDHIYPIFDQMVSRGDKEKFLNQKSHVFWFTGLSGSGKSTIARQVERELFQQGFFVQLIDGDNVRTGLCNNLGFSLADRRENIRRISELAKIYVQSGIVTLCSFVSPTNDIRNMSKDIIGTNDYSLIFVDTPLEECERRDVKGLYKKARRGEIKGFTGISSPFEKPQNAALIVKTIDNTINDCSSKVVAFINEKIKIL